MFKVVQAALFILLILVNQLPSHAQFRNNNWIFGDSAGVNFDNGINFFKGGSGFFRGTASISDTQGNLIFYGSTSNSTNSHTGQIQQGKLFNELHTKLFNGDTLVGGEWYHDMLILPKSVTDSTFYVFVAGVVYPDTGLWVNIVDMKLQGGLGQMVQKNLLLETHPVQDMLAAVRHGNGKDWWLVTRRWTYAPGYVKNNEFWVYLVDSTGIHTQPVQFVGTPHFDGSGDITFNSTGDKMVLAGWGSYLGVFDFDRCSGLISNEVIVEQYAPPASIFKLYMSAVFSPDGSRLYAVSLQDIYNLNSKLYQFDLLASNIPGSRVLLDTFPIEASPGGMELAPDGKIYISCVYAGSGSGFPYPSTCWNYINENLSVINQPDSLGFACDFQPFSFSLGGARTYYGLPNNPDYELGAWLGSPCDTLTVGLTPGPGETSPSEERGAWLQAWYNHEWNMIHVNAAQLKGKKGLLRLFDIEGRIVFEKPAEVVSGGYYTTEIYMSEMANGVYLVNLVTEKDALSYKVMK